MKGRGDQNQLDPVAGCRDFIASRKGYLHKTHEVFAYGGTGGTEEPNSSRNTRIRKSRKLAQEYLVPARGAKRGSSRSNMGCIESHHPHPLDAFEDVGTASPDTAIKWERAHVGYKRHHTWHVRVCGSVSDSCFRRRERGTNFSSSVRR